MKTITTICILLYSIAGMAQDTTKTSIFTGGSLYGTGASLFAIRVEPDTLKAAMMIANKRFSGRPRLLTGTVIKTDNWQYLYYDQKGRLIDRNRILWAKSYQESNR